MLGSLIFNVHDVVLLITAYLCLMFSLLIVLLKETTKNKLFLAGFLLCHALIPLDMLISFGGVRSLVEERAPYLFYLFAYAYWLEAPLLLLYTRSLIYKRPYIRIRDLLVLLPLLFYVINIFPYYLMSAEEKRLFLQTDSIYDYTFSMRAMLYLREAGRLYFLSLCVYEIYRYRKHIRDTFSNIESIDFGWLKAVVLGFFGLMVWQILVVLGIELNIGFRLPVDFEALGLARNYALLVLVSLLVFYSVSHSSVFAGVDPGKLQPLKNKPIQKVSQKDVDRLEAYMLAQKPYLRGNVTVEDLAQDLSLPSRGLSRVINRHFGKNFFEFVNHYRVEEAKRLLGSPDKAHLNVLDVMLESGFNSKAAFNTFFKKYTGMTPSEYRKHKLSS